MNNIHWTCLLGLILGSTRLFAIANAPIQQVDLANLLSNGGGVTQSPVQVNFYNNGSISCFSATLPFQGSITVLAGIGQPCTTAITSITITPLASPSGYGPVYDVPAPFVIDSSYYSTQMKIVQNSSPIFDPTDGSLKSQGTVRATLSNHLKILNRRY